jgi:hypothetical protein
MNRNQLLAALSLVVVSLITATGAQAQGKKRPGGDRLKPEIVQFRANLKLNSAHLTTVEAMITRLEGAQQITQRNSDDIDEELLAYATGIKTAYDQAQAQAQAAGQSKGTEGNVENFLYFEQTAQSEQKKARLIQKRLEALDAKIRAKRVRFVDSSSAREPEAESVVLATYTRFLGSLSSCIDGDWSLVSSAEAALAIPCIAPCAAHDWGKCATCIVSKAPGAIQAWNQFQSCWNGAKKPFQAAKRAACVVVFLAKIA